MSVAKIVLIALTVLGVISMLAFNRVGQTSLQNSTTNINQAFSDWEELYGQKSYSEEELDFRKMIFEENLLKIAELNSQNDGVTYGENQFMTMTQEEFEETQLGYKPYLRTAPFNYVSLSTNDIANDVDWRNSGAVTGVKDQGRCGSCWAFSTTGSLEGLDKIAKGQLDSFSEQQLVDCSWGYGNMGCNGGLMDNAFEYVQDKGVTTEDQYPYKGKDQRCKKGWTSVFSISGYTDVPPTSDDQLKAAIQKQPVSIAVDATNWKFYKSGVFKNCEDNLNHGVLAVGYTDSAWIVKNSWSATWGESGYIQLAAGNTCGCEEQASYANA